jgi:hypothetical protein
MHTANMEHEMLKLNLLSRCPRQPQPVGNPYQVSVYQEKLDV